VEVQESVMPEEAPPKGYIFRAAPQSVQEAVSRASHDRIKSITKQAIQHYIEQFMNTTGVKRSITESVGSLSKLFITDTDTLTTDPTLRPTQLVRYYQDIRERLPAVLIVDSGMEYVDPGLNTIDNATSWGEEGELGNPLKWQGQFPITFNIPITIICAAADQESADALGAFLCLVFGPLRNLSGGQRITGRDDKGDTWEVRLPLDFVPSPTTNSAIADDPKDSVWAMTIDLLVQYEDRIILEQEMADVAFNARNFTTGEYDLSTNLSPIIDFPDEIKLHENYYIRVTQLQDRQRIVLSDGKIATFDPESLLLTPKKLGCFEIQVLDRRHRQSEGAALAPVVAATKTVNVVL
jgi:hypothetical protein